MKCEICGVDDTKRKIRKIKGMNLCSTHITQLYRHGHFLKETIYSPNEYVIFPDHAEIILKNKQCKEVGRAKIDLEDVDKCRKYKWHIRHSRNTDYVVTSLKGNQKIHLHQYVLNYYGDQDIDHLNRDGLDNQKINLQIKSHADNLRNQSNERKGIILTPSGKYASRIMIDYRSIHLGTFETYDQALDARIKAEQNLF